MCQALWLPLVTSRTYWRTSDQCSGSVASNRAVVWQDQAASSPGASPGGCTARMTSSSEQRAAAGACPAERASPARSSHASFQKKLQSAWHPPWAEPSHCDSREVDRVAHAAPARLVDRVARLVSHLPHLRGAGHRRRTSPAGMAGRPGGPGRRAWRGSPASTGPTPSLPHGGRAGAEPAFPSWTTSSVSAYLRWCCTRRRDTAGLPGSPQRESCRSCLSVATARSRSHLRPRSSESSSRDLPRRGMGAPTIDRM